MAWLDGEWSPTIRISDAIEQKWWEKNPQELTGVYRLVALQDNQGFIPQPLNRVAGTDETGTLYVGGSERTLASRIASLIKTHHHEYKSTPHRELPKRLAETFSGDRLGISWELTGDPWGRELALLRAYEDAFGELPPTNRSGREA